MRRERGGERGEESGGRGEDERRHWILTGEWRTEMEDLNDEGKLG